MILLLKEKIEPRSPEKLIFNEKDKHSIPSQEDLSPWSEGHSNSQPFISLSFPSIIDHAFVFTRLSSPLQFYFHHRASKDTSSRAISLLFREPIECAIIPVLEIDSRSLRSRFPFERRFDSINRPYKTHIYIFIIFVKSSLYSF